MQAPGEFRGPSAVHNLKARLLAARILILAGDTDGNLGDRAIVTATCQRLRRIDPDAEISLVTSRPGRDRECLGIVPIARGLRGLPQLIQAARRSDLVICGGGGLFQDDDSLAKMPYWALRLLMLRPFSRRIAGLSIGAGPLRYRVSRMFARSRSTAANKAADTGPARTCRLFGAGRAIPRTPETRSGWPGTEASFRRKQTRLAARRSSRMFAAPPSD